MGGNSFGTLFRVTTWGESHGKDKRERTKRDMDAKRNREDIKL
jgi:hypothetical protein